MKSEKLPSKEAVQLFYLSESIVRELAEHRRWAERILFFAGIVSAAMAIPQIINIFVAQDSSQVSLVAWSYYILVNALWITYAYIFKRPVVKRVQLTYLLSNALVVSSILLFRLQ